MNMFYWLDKPVFVSLNFSGRDEVGQTEFQFVILHISFVFISWRYSSVLANRIRNTSITFRRVLKLRYRSRNSPVSIVTLLRNKWPGNRGLFPARHREFFLLRRVLTSVEPTSLLSDGTIGLRSFSEGKATGA